MSYFITKHGTIIDNNNQEVVMTDGEASFELYKEFLQNDGEVFQTEFVTPKETESIRTEATIARYAKFKQDGAESYESFRADIVSKVFKRELEESQAFIISKYLSNSYDRIKNNGDWKTAYFELGLVTIPSQYGYVNEFKKKAIEIMQKYIATNY